MVSRDDRNFKIQKLKNLIAKNLYAQLRDKQ